MCDKPSSTPLLKICFNSNIGNVVNTRVLKRVKLVAQIQAFTNTHSHLNRNMNNPLYLFLRRSLPLERNPMFEKSVTKVVQAFVRNFIELITTMNYDVRVDSTRIYSDRRYWTLKSQILVGNTLMDNLVEKDGGFASQRYYPLSSIIRHNNKYLCSVLDKIYRLLG
uniref:Uncharacterized protein n=1 Tax=Glossina pallidipes TaxID=7398 RepID=A0A1A9ZBI9_GLOPL